MDQYLIEYLKSGKAWLLVGSGPSTAIGYPSWGALARSAFDLCKVETVGRDLSGLTTLLNGGNFTEVLEKAAEFIGMPRLLQHLQRVMIPEEATAHRNPVYDHLARWPVAVYMTTNFDHEVTKHLSAIGESSYLEYANSEAHFSALVPDISGAIVHLHGDLRSEQGLILTETQYRDILNAPQWQYWRTKMTSIFQMNRIIVVGHSLFDPHIKHVLRAAKRGAGVVQPVCWIAPDVSHDIIEEYLEEYRIRVITYDNHDHSHRNLVRLIESISDFIPPRIAVRASRAVAEASRSPLGASAAAPGFFVFTKLSVHTDWESKRIQVMVAALRSAVQRLIRLQRFSLQQALELVGWPAALPINDQIANSVATQAISAGLLVRDGDLFSLANGADQVVKAEQDRFQGLRGRFQQSLQNRLRRTFASLSPEENQTIATDIDAALAGYFREGGLTLASTLAATGQTVTKPTIPSSVLQFINEASARYDNHLMRQAFSTVSLQAFVSPESVEREYLGRVSQGFFAFHLLGVFGDAAFERLQHARDTIWILDSSAQIPAIAVGSAAHPAFRDMCKNLSALGIRLFTTERLFNETREHLWFANKVVSDSGPASPQVIAAARGDSPYRKGNLFLEGFINWQAAGNPRDWDRYLISISGTAGVGPDAVQTALKRLPVESIDFRDWPGFEKEDYAEAEGYVETIIKAIEGRNQNAEQPESEELRNKATPEAEAAVIVLHERDGKYYLLSSQHERSPAWFLTQTAILNSICPGQRITWQPEAFMRFAATLAPTSDQAAADRAFDMLLWPLAQSGVVVLDDRIAVTVFGGVIDQAKLTITEQHAAYEKALGEKYGEPIEKVLERVPALQQPLAALQLANERAAKESELREMAQAAALEANRRAKTAETELASVQRYQKKMHEKQREAEKRKRRGRSKPKRKH
jgi:hypothetical protein